LNYTRSAVYDSLYNAINAEYPDAYITSRYVAKPPSFPACLIREIDRNRPLENTQLDFQDVQWESVFEVQVASAKVNTASYEAYGIMDVVRQAFSNLYYREFSETIIDSGDTFTIIGRFRRKIGGGDTMPPNISA
jgi:hypothetical protein